MGCALSETSKYFRDAVFPLQVHSVSLFGASKISIFLHEVLEKRPPEQRSVQHLYISRGEKAKVPQDVLRAILQYVGPTLRTLTILLPQNVLGSESVLCNPFPRLEELTIHGFFMDPVVTKRTQVQESLPSLKYLHILSSCNSALLYIARAPKLTHLRLSGLWSISDKMIYFMTRVADPAAPVPADLAGDDIPAPSLKSLILVPDIGMARFTQAQHGTRWTMFHSIRDKDRSNRISIVEEVYSEKPSPGALPAERRHWEERIIGGEGCWATQGSHNFYVRSPRRMELGL